MSGNYICQGLKFVRCFYLSGFDIRQGLTWPLQAQHNPCRNQSRCGPSPMICRIIFLTERYSNCSSPHCASLCEPQAGGSGGTVFHSGCTEIEMCPDGSSREFFSLVCQRNFFHSCHICTVFVLCGESCDASEKPLSYISHHTWGRAFLNCHLCGFASCG